MSFLAYRRPVYVPPTVGAQLSDEEKERIVNDSLKSSGVGRPGGIPDALSFERILNGDVCPPCTIRDFMNYLKYIEHAPENLQFFLWYRDYVQRWKELPESEQKLSPTWPLIPNSASLPHIKATVPITASAEVAEVFKGTDFDDQVGVMATVRGRDLEKFHPNGNPFETPPHTPLSSSGTTSSISFFKGGSESDKSEYDPARPEHDMAAGQAFRHAGLKWQPFTIQPFRDEVARIISIYIADGSPRQLNISSRERKALLYGLTQTTHPTVFRCMITNIEWTLRCQAHPNFIRWTICNGNRPRVVFARGLGVFCIFAGIMTGVLVTLSTAGRGWRVMSLIGLLVGISTLIAAWKGMCVVLHGLHHRHLRPWELFADETFDIDDPLKQPFADSRPTSKTSYEDEPWVAKYDRRNVIRKVFDREVWIEEPALRQIQDAIFWQSVLWSFGISAAITGIFCAVPGGGFY